MKTLRYLLAIMPLLLLCNCNSHLVGEPVAEKKYGKMGYHSILNYRYMPYTADSAVLVMRVAEIEPAMRHYNQSIIYLGQQKVADSNILPFDAEIQIPIIDDSVFHIKHVCLIDSLASFRDTLVHTVYVHKNEVVNAQSDTVSIVKERLDSMTIRTYYHNPNRFWWL